MSIQVVSAMLAFAIAGIFIAGYLTWQHFNKKKQPLVCPMDHDCSKVTESKWSTLFGIRNEQLGLLFFLSVIIGGVLSITVPQYSWHLYLAILLASGSALLTVGYLVYVQFVKIKDYCFYCLTSSILILLVFLSDLLLFLGF